MMTGGNYLERRRIAWVFPRESLTVAVGAKLRGKQPGPRTNRGQSSRILSFTIWAFNKSLFNFFEIHSKLFKDIPATSIKFGWKLRYAYMQSADSLVSCIPITMCTGNIDVTTLSACLTGYKRLELFPSVLYQKPSSPTCCSKSALSPLQPHSLFP